MTRRAVADLDALIAELTVDAYDDGEQLAAFLVAADEAMPVPQIATIVGVDVHVVGIDQGPDERRGLEAVCQRDGTDYRVSLADLAFDPDSEIATVVATYRHWLGLNPWLPTRSGPLRSDERWRYPGHGAGCPAPLGGRPPLELRDARVWDPRAEYWDDPDARLPHWWTAIMAAGLRVSYELERVLPGLDDDAWFDPILDAVDHAHAGHPGVACRKLRALLDGDPRCLDAYAHLGWLEPEPDQALAHYQAGVAIAELSFPDGFNGVLSWGRLDNRPFLRCLHGLTISLWRLARFDEALAAAESLLWLNPADHQGASAILPGLRARRPWRKPREPRLPRSLAPNASISQAPATRASQEPKEPARRAAQAMPGAMLRRRWLQTLLRTGVATVGQLQALSDQQLQEIPNIGPKAMADIATALATPGLNPDDPLQTLASPMLADRDRRDPGHASVGRHARRHRAPLANLTRACPPDPRAVALTASSWPPPSRVLSTTLSPGATAVASKAASVDAAAQPEREHSDHASADVVATVCRPGAAIVCPRCCRTTSSTTSSPTCATPTNCAGACSARPAWAAGAAATTMRSTYLAGSVEQASWAPDSRRC